jgi:N-acetylneuraminic acid mutarotase
MNSKFYYLSLLILLLTMETFAQEKAGKLFFWSQAQLLPDPEGFAGPYTGVSGGALLVAGGSNFPGNKRPWQNGTKKWYENIYALEKPNGKWKLAGTLPKAMGYGVALTYKNEMICIGGGDTKNCYKDVFSLEWAKGSIRTCYLPPLPAPLMNACGVISDNILYIMCGIESPLGETTNHFWSLELNAPKSKAKWKILEDLPGKSRMLAAAGTFDGKVYLFGGVHLFSSGPQMEREYLKDCWVYTPGKGWKKITDLPFPLAATPSPALALSSSLLLFGGDDGSNASRVSELKDRHPGFRNDILGYNVKRGEWSRVDEIPVVKKNDSTTHPHNSLYAPVTTPLVLWNHKIVIAGGEARPGVRSNRVLIAEPRKKNK